MNDPYLYEWYDWRIFELIGFIPLLAVIALELIIGIKRWGQ